MLCHITPQPGASHHTTGNKTPQDIEHQTAPQTNTKYNHTHRITTEPQNTKNVKTLAVDAHKSTKLGFTFGLSAKNTSSHLGFIFSQRNTTDTAGAKHNKHLRRAPCVPPLTLRLALPMTRLLPRFQTPKHTRYWCTKAFTTDLSSISARGRQVAVLLWAKPSKERGAV